MTYHHLALLLLLAYVCCAIVGRVAWARRRPPKPRPPLRPRYLAPAPVPTVGALSVGRQGEQEQDAVGQHGGDTDAAQGR